MLNKIHHGNSLDLLQQPLDPKPNLIIMSPPDLAETNYSLPEYRDFINNIYSLAINSLSDSGVLASITTDRKKDGQIYTKHIDIINSLQNKATLFNYKIWAKSLKTNLYILNYCHMLFFKKSDKYTNNKLKDFFPDVWLIELDKVKGYKNKDSFPSELVRRIILNFTNENDLVLDPFIGTGKTAKIAKQLKRNFLGFELDENNIKIAEEFLND
jgi:DNA modification methylase